MPSTESVPDFHESLGLGITPGEPGLFEFVRATAPPLAPGDRPTGDHAAVRQRVEDREPIGGTRRKTMMKYPRGTRRFR